MSNRLTEFADRLAGVDDGLGVDGVEEIAATGDDRLGVIFDEDAQVGVQMAANETGVEELGRERVGGSRMGMVVQDPNAGFFDEPAPEPNPNQKRVAPTDIHREPDGEFQRAPTALDPVPEQDAFRGPNGEFVSGDLEPADEIGRRESNGFFDLLR